VSKPSLGIIGYGDFSRLIIKYLSPHLDIVVSTRQASPKKSGLNFKKVSLATALQQDIIIPSIPTQALEEFFTTYRQLVNPASLVVDVCSVKVKSTAILKRLLPKSVQILATHPLFGPASAADILVGKRIMLYPVRLKAGDYQLIKQFLIEALGLMVVEVTPQQHDQAMAYVQGLSHYIGRLMQLMEIPPTELTTRAYDDLLDMKRIQGQDSWELFEAIMFENPYSLAVNAKFKQAMKQLDAKLGIS
jgi:prephenate dehydrogenase